MKYKNIEHPKYKYEITEKFTYKLDGNYDIKICYEGIKKFKITYNNYLVLESGFQWDGVTGGLDTKKCIWASAVHDALCIYINYQFYNEPKKWYKYRKIADKQFINDIKRSNMKKSWCNIRRSALFIFRNLKYYKILAK